MLWRLKVPLRDADVCRRQNLALAEALGGDPTVVNPSRVLRLGGSIAWPLKEGRVIEPTEFLEFSDGRPKEYLAEQIAKAFPPPELPFGVPPERPAARVNPAPAAAPQPPADAGMLQIGTSPVSVEACLARIRAGDHWHNNLVRLTGHWISRGWSDAEILTAAEALTLPGYTVAHTRREVAAMIAGARRKWGVANVVHEIGAEDEARPDIIDPRAWAGQPLPNREWLVENWIPMNHVTALYGDGGLGKTLLAQQLATSAATGKPWLGLPVRQVRSFGLLCEDHADDLHLNQDRINGACWIDYSQLGDLRLWPSVGFDNLLMTFDGKESSKGNLTAFFARLLDEVRKFGARFVVLDTAADLFGGNENIRSQVRQFVANACGRIAREIGGAVLLCAHPSLSGMASGSGSSGSTAWNNTVRSRLYLTQAPAEDGPEPDPDLRVLTRKKSNYARAGETLTLRWSDGVMVPVAAGSETDDADVRRRVLEEIDRAWREGQPYSEMPQARTRFVLAHLPHRIGLGRSAVERAYLALLSSGHIRSELHDRHRNLRGLRAAQRGGEQP
jgi:RecA-family ATPase